MKARNEKNSDDQADYTEINFYKAILSEEVLRRAKNLIKEYKIRERAIKIQKIKKSNLENNSQKHN